MNTLFVYPNASRYLGESIGVASLIGTIFSIGVECDFFDGTFFDDEEIKANFKLAISNNKYSIIFFHCTSADWWLVQKMLKWTNEETSPKPLTVIGAQHPTIVPEDVIKNLHTDCLVIGEGEFAVVDIINCVKEGNELSHIPNCWVKNKSGLITRNDVRDLVQNLDDLPCPELGIFDDRHRRRYDSDLNLVKVRPVNIETSRGCPYSCTFCMNSSVRKLYANKGNFFRNKSVNRIIYEAKRARDVLNANFIQFIDDNFCNSKERLEELSDRFPEEIGLPVSLQLSADKITPEAVELLKKMGVEIIAIGIETGNEKYRNEILRKNVTDSQILEAINLIKSQGIGTMAYYMIGLPLDTKKNIEQTIRFNEIAKPDICVVSTFYPFPGTVLHQAVLENNMLVDREFSLDFYHDSSLILPDLEPGDIEKYRSEFKNVATFLGPLKPRNMNAI